MLPKRVAAESVTGLPSRAARGSGPNFGDPNFFAGLKTTIFGQPLWGLETAKRIVNAIHKRTGPRAVILVRTQLVS